MVLCGGCQGNAERRTHVISHENVTVTLRPTYSEEDIEISVSPHDRVLKAVRSGLTLDPTEQIHVTLGGFTVGVDYGITFHGCGIRESGTLLVEKKASESFADIADAIVGLNSHVTLEQLESRATFYPDGSKSNLKCLDLSTMELKELPNSVGALSITGELSLANNLLDSLPHGFCDLAVGSVDLTGNKLRALPAHISDIYVLGDLIFRDNQIEKLPDDIGDVTVGNHLDLSGNLLTTLPDSAGDLAMGGELILLDNPLKKPLPDSIAKLEQQGCTVIIDADLRKPDCSIM